MWVESCWSRWVARVWIVISCYRIFKPAVVPPNCSSFKRPVARAARCAPDWKRSPECAPRLISPHVLLCQRVSRSEEHTPALQSRGHLVCGLLPENKKEHEKNLATS